VDNTKIHHSEWHQDQEKKAAFYFSIGDRHKKGAKATTTTTTTTTTYYPLLSSTDKALSQTRRVLQQRQSINHQLSSVVPSKKQSQNPKASGLANGWQSRKAGRVVRFPSSIVCSLFSSTHHCLARKHSKENKSR
jgi:hypothetical protein